MKRRLTSALVVFAYFTAVGLMFFGYRYLEYVANREAVSPLEPFINEVLTGAWMAALLFPLVARFARRYPFDRFNWMTRLPLHVCALAVYSLAHTSLLWVLRNTLYPLFGLRHYDYGDMTARYPMEFFHDVIVYTVIVSLLHLFDRHVRAAQVETQLAHARLENLRLQLQPHFLFNALNTISAVVYEDPRKADAMIAGLSDLLRRTITDADAQLVPLAREIETLELYLNIMRRRFARTSCAAGFRGRGAGLSAQAGGSGTLRSSARSREGTNPAANGTGHAGPDAAVSQAPARAATREGDLPTGRANRLGGRGSQLYRPPRGRQRLHRPHDARPTGPPARSRSVRARQSIAARESRQREGAAAVVPRRTADRAQGRARADVDASLQNHPGRVIPATGPLVPLT